MKRLFVLSFLVMTLEGYAQVKPGLLGFSANTVNFSGNSAYNGKYDVGFSAMYWKGIASVLDFSVRYNGLFSDYARGAQNNTKGYVNEFEGSFHLRPISDDHFFSPFLSAGGGIGNYGSKWAAYAPVGAGLQFRLDPENYIVLQANYRISMKGSVLDNNMFYSIGFLQAFRSPRPKPVKPLPSAPVVVTDRDNDGVPDSVDACPDLAGLPALKGCPDSDGDGIADKDDQCPNQKGTAKYKGCPIPDSDGDGINDEEDKCPQVAGVSRYQGCPIPDRDGDGVNDEEDRCPDLAGDKSNHGCPVVKEEVRKRVNYAAQHVYFATASFVLLKKSFTGLDEIVAIMKSDAALKLYVDGYTDNTGRPEKNQILSDHRAGSVKEYFLSKGIETGRIVSAGHGQDNPVADNKTAAGRAQNRRVEMKLDYQ
jgi:outer membrane protein OmpA-like peptidoglycan-associated protein